MLIRIFERLLPAYVLLFFHIILFLLKTTVFNVYNEQKTLENMNRKQLNMNNASTR